MSAAPAQLLRTNLVLLALLALVFNREVYSHLGDDVTRGLDRLRSDALVKEKSRSELMTYYEELLFRGGDSKYFLNQRYAGYRHAFDQWDPFDGEGSPHWQPIDDLRKMGPRASRVIELDGIPHRFNSLGLRDREYGRAKPSGTYRILMLGASNLMGRGIPDGAGFEPVLERLLNERLVGGWRYEVLNFGYDGYTEVKQLAQIDAGLVFPLDPDLLLFVTHAVHDFWEPHFLELAVASAYERIGYPHLVELAKRIRLGWARGSEQRALTDAEREDVLRWVYGEFGQRCERAGVPCVAVGVPLPHSVDDPVRLRERLDVIGSTGFATLSLEQSLLPYDIVALQHGAWDDMHFNERGHRIIAEDLYTGLVRADRELGLGLVDRSGERAVLPGGARAGAGTTGAR